jgi:cobyrinic acid a,c-diamide synthase
MVPRPRLVFAGTAGDSGKTLVCLGLLRHWARDGVRLAAFKKGPDYIDAAWLALASGSSTRNLDTYLMEPEVVRRSFVRQSSGADLSVIEGSRGLLDGQDARGTHSTAVLARLLRAPTVLVLPVTKTTRSAAAFVAGCIHLEPDLDLAGVILNRVGGPRHERVLREAIEGETGIPVLGAIPKLDDGHILPDRHLGLVPPQERDPALDVPGKLADLAARFIDADALLERARRAVPLEEPEDSAPAPRVADSVRVGVLRDPAFTFYYPENLEALEAAGAVLVPISALEDAELPPVDALYLGGGFPETHGARLAANASMLASVRRAALAGLPVYAECGGLMYLSESVIYRGERWRFAGVLPVTIEVHDRPQGHGYAEMCVDRENPFYAPGTVLKGHEFHYSRIASCAADTDLVFDVRRGTGCLSGRDGIVVENVLATYLHLHALGSPEWAPALVKRASIWRDGRVQHDIAAGCEAR